MVTDERANDAAKEIGALIRRSVLSGKVSEQVLADSYLVRQAIAEIVQRAIDGAIDDRVQDAESGG